MKRNLVVGIVSTVAVIVILITVFYDGAPSELGVSRVLGKDSVSPGEVFEVELHVVLGEGQVYYIAEETVPEGFVASGNNVGKDNKVRIVEIQNAESKVYTYSVVAPAEAGTYVFSGEYAIGGVEGMQVIGGKDTVVVA